MPKSKSKEPKKSKKQEKKVESVQLEKSQTKEEKLISKEDNAKKRKEITHEFSDDFEELLLEEDFIPSSPSLRRINSHTPTMKLEKQAQEVFLEKDKKEEKGIYSARTSSVYDSQTAEEKKDYNLTTNSDTGRRLDLEQNNNLLLRNSAVNSSFQQWGNNNQDNQSNKDREYVSEGKRMNFDENNLPFQQSKKQYRLR